MAPLHFIARCSIYCYSNSFFELFLQAFLQSSSKPVSFVAGAQDFTPSNGTQKQPYKDDREPETCDGSSLTAGTIRIGWMEPSPSRIYSSRGRVRIACLRGLLFSSTSELWSGLGLDDFTIGCFNLFVASLRFFGGQSFKFTAKVSNNIVFGRIKISNNIVFGRIKISNIVFGRIKLQ